MSKNKDYLGDSVYAHTNERGSLVLTVENGEITDPSETIILDEEVLAALDRYITRARAERRMP